MEYCVGEGLSPIQSGNKPVTHNPGRMELWSGVPKPNKTFYTKFYSFTAPKLFNTIAKYIKYYTNFKIFCKLLRQ